VDFNLAVQAVITSSAPLRSIAGGYEEFLWRSGVGIQALKVLQVGLLDRVDECRERILKQSHDDPVFVAQLVHLCRATDATNLGSVSMALSRYRLIHPVQRSAILD